MILFRVLTYKLKCNQQRRRMQDFDTNKNQKIVINKRNKKIEDDKIVDD